MKKNAARPVSRKKPKKISEAKRIKDLFRNKASVTLDIGCGEYKSPGSIGVDFRKMKGVDIVQDLGRFPWSAIPKACADVVVSHQLLEHINPDSPDPRLAGLVDLLLEKGLITNKEVSMFVGEYRFLGGFIRFMDEVWETLKPGGQFLSDFPRAGSSGYWQDPTHVNPITAVTLTYFDPLAKVEGTEQLYNLYTIYRPKPWKILRCFVDVNGMMEIALEKRITDPSYKTLNNGLNA